MRPPPSAYTAADGSAIDSSWATAGPPPDPLPDNMLQAEHVGDQVVLLLFRQIEIEDQIEELDGVVQRW